MAKQDICIKCGTTITEGSFKHEWDDGWHCPACHFARDRKPMPPTEVKTDWTLLAMSLTLLIIVSFAFGRMIYIAFLR